jgi:hypothetical protein
MAAPPLSASPVPRRPLYLPTHCHSFPLSRLCLRPTPTKVTTARPSVLAAATSALEVGQASLSAIPSKALPFRVGHGFDLHRLEPGYPLIIGGIDIPHDRGCEAHSDGNFIKYCFWVLLVYKFCDSKLWIFVIFLNFLGIELCW